MLHFPPPDRYRTARLRRAMRLVGGGLLGMPAMLQAAQEGPAPAANPGAYAEPASPVPFDEVRGLPPRPEKSTGGKVEDTLPDPGGEGWNLAPIRWGGNTSSLLNAFRDDLGGQTLNNTQTVNLRTSSHIYQPWFAQVNGNVGLLTSAATRNGSGVEGSSSSRSTAFNYGGSLNLFPLSRFPLQAYIDQGDSRASANDTGSSFKTSRLGLRQSYRPETGTDNYSFSYDRSTVEADIARSSVDTLQGNYSVSLEQHSLSLGTRYSRNQAGLTGESSRTFGLNGAHTWRYDETLSVSSSAYLNNQEIHYLSGNMLSLNRSRLVQASSGFTWLPDEDLPLTVTGSANLLATSTDTGLASSQLANVGGLLGFSYRLSQRLTAAGNFQASQTSNGGIRQSLLAGNGLLSYSGEPLTFGNYFYNWNASGSVAAQTLSGTGSVLTQSGQVGHSLNRSIAFNEGNVINLTASQGLSATHSGQSGAATTLAHSAGVSWRLGYGSNITGLFSAMAADNLTRGEYSSHYRSFNLNGNGLFQLSRRSSLTAYANLAWSQQRQAQQELQLGSQLFNLGSSQWTGSASLGYQNAMALDIRNLSYSASVQLTTTGTDRGIFAVGASNLNRQQSTSFQNRLDYRLGRLNFQLLGSLASVNGKKSALLFFQMNRDFGDF